jgi:6-phosphogluconolactonase
VRQRIMGAAAAGAVAMALASGVSAQAAQAHVAFTLSNAANGNRVLVFAGGSGGALHRVGSVATRGLGTGANLGSEGAIALSPNGHRLYAVNAGSNTLTVLHVDGTHVWVAQRVGTAGAEPISVTASWNRVYVLNAGDGSVTGFRVTAWGLARISGAHRPLAATASGPAQVSLDPRGDVLVVTNKATNTIDTFRVRANGSLGSAVAHPSNGATPFGFAFTPAGTLIVSDAAEAPTSAVTAYHVGRFGGLRSVSGPLQTNQQAACWVATSPDSRWAFVADAHSGTVSTVRVGRFGHLSLVDPSGISGSGGAGSTTLDEAVSSDGRYLSVLVYNTTPGVNAVVTFRIGSDGSLTRVNGARGVPAGATGLTAE